MKAEEEKAENEREKNEKERMMRMVVFSALLNERLFFAPFDKS